MMCFIIYKCNIYSFKDFFWITSNQEIPKTPHVIYHMVLTFIKLQNSTDQSVMGKPNRGKKAEILLKKLTDYSWLSE